MDHICVSAWINLTNIVLREKKPVAGNVRYEVLHANVQHLPNNTVIIQRFIHTP